jgi:hypothetical protein
MRKSPNTHFSRRPWLVSLGAAVAAALAAPVSVAQIAFVDATFGAGLGGQNTESWGAAWGDVNGDGYPDVFFNNHRNRATLYRNNRNGTFSEVSRQVDLSATPGWTGGRANVDTHGATWGDIDNDGDQDLYEAVESSIDRLHLNDSGLLTDRSVQLGVSRLTHFATRQVLFFDYNRDGRLDLASVSLQRPSFAPQLADGSFGSGIGMEIPLACRDGQWAHLVDVHPTPGLELLCAPRNGSYPKVNAFANGGVQDVSAQFRQFPSIIDAASLDYDGDQRPDLLLLPGAERPSDAFQPSSQRFEAQFITGGKALKSVTFRTTGTVTVTASTSFGSNPEGDPAGIDIGSAAWSPGSLVFQLSRADSRNWGIATGAPGFNVGYLSATDQWKIAQGNNGSFTYSYVQVTSTAPITGLTFAGASVSDRPQQVVLLRNTSGGLVPVSGAGLAVPMRCQSVVAGDFDNDMDEDLFIACTSGSRNTANRLFRNNGNGTFTEIAGAGGAAGKVGAAVAAKAGTSESVVAADYDLDGFLDLLVTNGNNMRPVYFGGPTQLFRNRGNANHWLQFDLVGTSSNRDGVGAQVYVTAGGKTQYRAQDGGYHRWSQNSQRIHVGLGGNSRADVKVVWPNGTTRTYAGLASNRVYRLRQDGLVSRVGI